jgi:hypothetical protein
VYVASGLSINPGLKLSLTLFNIHPTDSGYVSNIFVNWDGTANLEKATLGSSDIWTGSANPPSALISGFSGDTELPASSSKPLVLQFGNGTLNASASTIVIVGFDSGCTVSSTFN